MELLPLVPVTGRLPAGGCVPAQSTDGEELPVPSQCSFPGKNVWGLPTLGSSSIRHGLVRNDSSTVNLLQPLCIQSAVV